MPVRVIVMMTRIGWFGLCVALAAAPALAQEQRDGPLSIGVLGGVAMGRDGAGGTIGAEVGFDVNTRLSIELRGLYLDRGRRETAVEGTANVLVRLLTDRKVMPYVAVGGGVYHAMYDFSDWERLDDIEWNRMMGSIFGNRYLSNMNWGRMLPFDQMPRLMRGDSATDPALSFGGGVDIAVTPSLSVRPDLRGLMIFGGDTYTIGTATLSLGYRF
jgi:opacity protein-like surface antigen